MDDRGRVHAPAAGRGFAAVQHRAGPPITRSMSSLPASARRCHGPRFVALALSWLLLVAVIPIVDVIGRGCTWCNDCIVLAEHQKAGKRKAILAGLPILPPATELLQQSLLVEGQPWVCGLGRRKDIPIFFYGCLVQITSIEAFEDAPISGNLGDHVHSLRPSLATNPGHDESDTLYLCKLCVDSDAPRCIASPPLFKGASQL